MEWYRDHKDWWGDVSGALVAHPRLGAGVGSASSKDLKLAVGVEEEEKTETHAPPTTTPKMVHPSITPIAAKDSHLKFLIYGRCVTNQS
jgi:UDP-glucose 4,6-dehydratase